MLSLKTITAKLAVIKSICEHNQKWEYHETVSDFELIARQISVIENEIKELEKDHSKESKEYMRSGVANGKLINKLEE